MPSAPGGWAGIPNSSFLIPNSSASARDRDGFEDGADDGALGAAPFPAIADQRIGMQKPMGEDRLGRVLEVIGQHERPATNQRQSLR